jgi:hypothetical protein
MADAETAYANRQIEHNSLEDRWRRHRQNCDAEGKVHLGKVTEHSTKTGLKWGVVGGPSLE